MKDDFRLDAEQIGAVRTLLEYARSKFSLQRAEFKELCNLSNGELANFYVGYSPQVHRRIYNKLRDYFDEKFDQLDAWIVPVYSHLYGNNHRYRSEIKGLLENQLLGPIDASPKIFSAFCENYIGNYTVLRFAAQTENNSQQEDASYKYIRGRFSIYKPLQDGAPPTYRAYFRDREQSLSENLRMEEGIALPVGDYFFCIGFEQDRKFPVFMAAHMKQHKIEKYFSGLVLRPHSSAGLFSSRTLFIRENSSVNHLIRTQARFHSQQDLNREFNIPEIHSLLNNFVARNGQGVLFLHPNGVSVD